MIRAMHMTPASTVDEAVQLAREHKGPNARVALIPDGLGVVVQRYRLGPPNKIAATERPARHTTATIASDDTTTERNPMINHLFAEFASTALMIVFGVSTALMIVFGVGVHCDITLKGSKYRDSGHMFRRALRYHAQGQ